ncbi:MAG: penicillin-binding transpeptidase domain-containing protein [Candidatus Hydrothermales bacterium]
MNKVFLILIFLNIERIKKEIGDKGAFIIVDIKSGNIIDYHNRKLCFSTLLPPGSFFKIFTTIVLIEENIIDENFYVDCKGEEILEIDNDKIKVKCWIKNGHGKQNIKDALKNSCNIFFAKASLLIDPYLFIKYFKILKLDDLSTSCIGGEILNEIKIPLKKKNLIDFALGENGYIKMTLSSMLSFLVSISRNGFFVPLWIKEKNNLVYPLGIYNSLKILKESLRSVCKEGTGILANYKDRTAGKTGTPKHINGWRTHAIFAGYYPYYDPRIGIIVFLKIGQGSKDAAPLAKRILECLE